MSAEQIGALAALLTALAGVLTVVLVQARRVHIEDREQRRNPVLWAVWELVG